MERLDVEMSGHGAESSENMKEVVQNFRELLEENEKFLNSEKILKLINDSIVLKKHFQIQLLEEIQLTKRDIVELEEHPEYADAMMRTIKGHMEHIESEVSSIRDNL